MATSRHVDLSIGTRYPMLPQRLAGRDLFWWLSRLGLMRVTAGSRLGQRVQARGEFVIGTSRRRLERAGVRFRLEVGAVVWATGFRSDHSWIHVPGVVADGRVVHRRGVTDVPGLYFLDLSWRHTRGSALLRFVNDDTAYLADRIAERQQATAAADSG
jgi:putative flavoprotein involved in K+ transport